MLLCDMSISMINFVKRLSMRKQRVTKPDQQSIWIHVSIYTRSNTLSPYLVQEEWKDKAEKILGCWGQDLNFSLTKF